MNAFRSLLIIFIIGIASYTALVISQHGWDLFSVFFGDIFALTWSGQFNLDFFTFLCLSGLWLAWRHDFTPGALVLGFFGLVGGMMVLAPYLLYAMAQAKGNMKEVLLGARRANAETKKI